VDPLGNGYVKPTCSTPPVVTGSTVSVCPLQLHESFVKAFGVEKAKRIGETFCEDLHLEINPRDVLGSVNYSMTSSGRTLQRKYMDKMLYNPDRLRRFPGPDGRVLVFVFMRAAGIYLDRLLEAAAAHQTFENIVIIVLPFADHITRAGGGSERAAYKAKFGKKVRGMISDAAVLVRMPCAHAMQRLNSQVSRDDLNVLRHVEVYNFYCSILTPVTRASDLSTPVGVTTHVYVECCRAHLVGRKLVSTNLTRVYAQDLWLGNGGGVTHPLRVCVQRAVVFYQGP